jgi:hypothetical protein
VPILAVAASYSLAVEDAPTWLDERITFELTKREALELCASVDKYLELSEQQAAADDDPAHRHEQAERRKHLGQLIWRLDQAARWPRRAEEHQAVNPGDADANWP